MRVTENIGKMIVEKLSKHLRRICKGVGPAKSPDPSAVRAFRNTNRQTEEVNI